MNEDYNQFISEAFEELPRSNDDFFYELWHNNRIKYENREDLTDDVDVKSAQLVCAALSSHKKLLLVLPDHFPWRMPLLFATGLVMHTLDNRGQNRSRQIVYFGKGAAIKSHLSKTQILKLKLDNIYDQINLSNSSSNPSNPKNSLPNVLFSYSPANVKLIFENYKPDWVFIDCGSGTNTTWVFPILEELNRLNIPGIACVQNPLSDVIDLFQKDNWIIFSWHVKSLEGFQTSIYPIVIESEYGFKQADSFQKASVLLSECKKLAVSTFEKDSLRAIGRYLHSLETLPVPIKFWEAEVKNYWGIHSIFVHRQLAERYLTSLEAGKFRNLVNQILEIIIPRHEELSEIKPPFWLALEQLCIYPPKIPTVFVFQNQAHQRLFSLAMLAENNIAENELQETGVWLTNIKEFAQWETSVRNNYDFNSSKLQIPKALLESFPEWHPFLIGVPTKGKSAYYTHFLQFKNLHVLLSPHQISLAHWHFKRWNEIFNKTPSYNISSLLKFISPTMPNPTLPIPSLSVPRVSVANQDNLVLNENAEKKQSRMNDFIKLSPRIEELAYLLEEIVSPDDSDAFGELDSGSANADLAEETSEIIEKIILVSFHSKFEVMFSQSDKIKVIKDSSQGKFLEEQYVRALKPGDKVLFISGPRRQNLYDLIISRVHDHPIFALHLTLIERWHHEFKICFSNSKKTFSNLLQDLQAKGSNIQSELAIRQWYLGTIMCPQDYKDLKRLAEILNMPFVKQYQSQIFKAAQRIRGIHRVLSRKLNAWLREEAFLSGSQSFKEKIDEELDLDFKDFQDALMILTVKNVCEKNGLFLLTDLGQLKPIN